MMPSIIIIILLNEILNSANTEKEGIEVDTKPCSVLWHDIRDTKLARQCMWSVFTRISS